MSSYINFYQRLDDKFIPIGSYSRNFTIYSVLQPIVPYGKIIPLTLSDFEEAQDDIKEDKKRYKELLAEEENTISLIMNAANTDIGDKLAAVQNCKANIADIQEAIDEYDFANHILQFYTTLYEEYHYIPDNYKPTNDNNHYIYAGVDACGDLESMIAETT